MRLLSLLGVATLTACTAIDLPLVPLDDPEEVERIPERAWVDTYGEGRLSPLGEPFAPREEGRWAPESTAMLRGEVVVVDIGERLGVVLDNGDVRMVVYLDRPDLRDVVVEPTRGTARPRSTPDGRTGVFFDAGARAVAVEDAGDHLLLEHEGSRFTARAWVSTWSVDHYWRVSEPEPPSEVDGRIGWTHLAEGADILDAPHGDWLATVNPAGAHPTVGTLARSPGWLEISLSDDDVTVRGFVRVEDTHADASCGASGGCLGGFGWGGWGSSHPNVLEGDVLHDGVDGPEVGVALRNMYLGGVDETGDGWLSVEVPTPWGMAPVWIDTWSR